MQHGVGVIHLCVHSCFSSARQPNTLFVSTGWCCNTQSRLCCPRQSVCPTNKHATTKMLPGQAHRGRYPRQRFADVSIEFADTNSLAMSTARTTRMISSTLLTAALTHRAMTVVCEVWWSGDWVVAHCFVKSCTRKMQFAGGRTKDVTSRLCGHVCFVMMRETRIEKECTSKEKGSRLNPAGWGQGFVTAMGSPWSATQSHVTEATCLLAVSTAQRWRGGQLASCNCRPL